MKATRDGDAAQEAGTFLEAWTASIAARSVETARELRTDDYRCLAPDGSTLSLDADLANIAALDADAAKVATRLIAAEREGADLRLRFELVVPTWAEAGEAASAWPCEMVLVAQDGAWRARTLAIGDAPTPHPVARRPAAAMLRRLARRLVSRRPARREPGFQELAYAPYLPGQDHALPRSTPRAPVDDPQALPVPPRELWLGYNYPVHGQQHVATMLDALAAQGFTTAAGDRILDVGCGAGRMIRHLAPLAERCEIWGADISAEHILWCQRNLSPPFHFLTNTKVPHLPFTDASFALIYCGSLFTHIDDMARAWLLELRRLLREDGYAYVTIHDEETIRQFEAYRQPPAIVRHIMSAPLWPSASRGSDMFTIGRDDRSQVFYARDWFERLVAPMFEVVAVLPEAYFYQTALVLRPRSSNR